MRALLVFALACGPQAEPLAPDPVEVQAWLDGPVSDKGGVLVVQTAYDPGGQVDLPQLEVEGLEFDTKDPVIERIGERDVVTQRITFQGKKGMYALEPIEATWHGADGPVSDVAPSVFVDLGVEPPREAEPEDIVEPDVVRVIPWAAIGGVGFGIALLGGGLWVAFGSFRGREIPEAPPEAPDVIALRAWSVVRADADLSDHEKALALSRIFRDYTDVALGFPASAWTTTEIVDRLRSMTHMPEGNVPRARRLLRATDRVKFAEHQPEVDFFEELDADLRAFVESTRPRAWGGEA